MSERDFSENIVRLAILAMLAAVCVFCEIVIHYWTNLDTGYTQFYYILIIIAGIWYQRKTIWIAFFLAVLHLSVTYALLSTLTWNSVVSASMFMCAAILVGLLSEEKEMFQKQLLTSKNEIEKKHAALIGYMTEYSLRLKLPVELVLDNFRAIYDALSQKSGLATQDVLDSILIQIKNTEQILANLKTINKAVAEERDDIPNAFREFLKR
ncbi:MAG: hypothetical protein ABR887_05510 [Methanoregulaceae archaeon]|jgi:hypothetical protein